MYHIGTLTFCVVFNIISLSYLGPHFQTEGPIFSSMMGLWAHIFNFLEWTLNVIYLWDLFFFILEGAGKRGFVISVVIGPGGLKWWASLKEIMSCEFLMRSNLTFQQYSRSNGGQSSLRGLKLAYCFLSKRFGMLRQPIGNHVLVIF